MEWQNFIDWLNGVTHNPAFIAVVSILSAFSMLLIIVSKTSIGKKAIIKITELANRTATKTEAALRNIEDKANKLADAKEELKVLENELNNKFNVYFNQFNFYETQMVEILKLIPNAKVQDKLVEFKAEWDNRKKEIESLVNIKYDEYQELKNKVNQLLEQNNDDKGTEE